MLQSDVSTVGELHGCAQYRPCPFGTKDAWYGEAMTGGQRRRGSPGAEVAGRSHRPFLWIEWFVRTASPGRTPHSAARHTLVSRGRLFKNQSQFSPGRGDRAA